MAEKMEVGRVIFLDRRRESSVRWARVCGSGSCCRGQCQLSATSGGAGHDGGHLPMLELVAAGGRVRDRGVPIGRGCPDWARVWASLGSRPRHLQTLAGAPLGRTCQARSGCTRARPACACLRACEPASPAINHSQAILPGTALPAHISPGCPHPRAVRHPFRAGDHRKSVGSSTRAQGISSHHQSVSARAL